MVGGDGAVSGDVGVGVDGGVGGDGICGVVGGGEICGDAIAASVAAVGNPTTGQSAR